MMPPGWPHRVSPHYRPPHGPVTIQGGRSTDRGFGFPPPIPGGPVIQGESDAARRLRLAMQGFNGGLPAPSAGSWFGSTDRGNFPPMAPPPIPPFPGARSDRSAGGMTY
jgi:hypothetical protein